MFIVFLVSTRVVKVQVPLAGKMCRYMGGGGYQIYIYIHICERLSILLVQSCAMDKMGWGSYHLLRVSAQLETKVSLLGASATM